MGENDIEINEGLTRREFLSQTGCFIAGLKLLPFLFRNRQASAQNNGNSESPNISSRVGIIKCDNRVEAVKRAFDLNSLPDMRGDKVLIKPNFNTADPAPGSTHNDTLETVIDLIKKQGADKVIIGERSGPPDTEEVMTQKGIFTLAKEKGIEVINFDQLPEEELLHFNQDNLHWRKGFHIPRILREVDHIIACGCLKTHQFGGQFTMALKLAVGIIPSEGTNYMNQLHGSPDIRKKIAEINLAYEPNIYLIDGVEAFTHGGPATGTRVQAGVTLVGTDPVAVDAVGVAVLKELGSKNVIMETPVFQLEQIARAAEIGLGVTEPEQIEVISDDNEGKEYAEKIENILQKN
ncbi:MAG: DUF362 domain-containing protein [Halanaerobiales bacterium]